MEEKDMNTHTQKRGLNKCGVGIPYCLW